MQRNWNRRKFITVGLSATGVILTAGTVQVLNNASSYTLRGSIRLMPVEGVNYTQSFIRFMQRARFDSVSDALASIRDRSLPVKIAHQSAIDLLIPLERATQTMVCSTRHTGNDRVAGSSFHISSSQ